MAVAFDKDKDYTAAIQQAVANNDYASAAQLEQQLNAKVNYLNETGTNKWNAQTSNKYSQYLNTGNSGGNSSSKSGGTSGSTGGGGQYVGVGKGSDYYAEQYMSPSDQALLKSYGDAYNNATTQAERDAAHEAAERLRAQYGYEGGDDGSEYKQIPQETPAFSFGSAPSYSDPYSSRIDAMLNDILNRDKFSYNAEEDDLYRQYRDQYTREGQRAMQDTLGQVAARTGGLASSYAVTAAQQQNNYYMQQLSDKIPELYQMAYQMYLDDIDLQVQDLGLLEGASDRQYGRYRDTMADWRDDRDFAYGQYRDDIADGQWQSTFDRGVFESDRDYNYGVGRDAIEDGRYDEKWAYQLAQDALSQSNWEAEQAYKREKDAAGVAPIEDDDLDDDSIEPDDDKNASLTGGLTGTEYLEEKRQKEEANRFWNSMNKLGIGPVSATFVSELADYGGIVENEDGTVKWADGWDAGNYKEKLEEAKRLAAMLSGRPDITALPTLNLGN